MRWQDLVFWVFMCSTQFLPCLSLWMDTKIGHKVDGKVVLIDFTPTENFTRYRVELWSLASSGNLTQLRCDGSVGKRLLVRNFSAFPESPVLRQKIENIGTAGYYCVRVNPVKVYDGGSCRSDCRSVASDVFFLQGNDHPDAYDCDKWCAFITLELQSLKRRAVVWYKSSSKCLHRFRISLWYMYNASRDCDGIEGYSLKSIVSYGPSNRVVFDDLEPGNYCVRIKPMDTTNCHGECLPQFSPRIQTLYPMLADEVPAVAFLAVRSEPSSAVWLYPTIVGALLLVLTTFAFAIRWRRRIQTETRVGNQMELQVELKEEKHKPNLDSTKKVSAPGEVVVLYSHDSMLEKEGARLLVDFLRECCGLSVCTAVGDIHLIAVSPEAWIVDKLSTGKIVIVESAGAVARQHSMLNRQCSSDGLLDTVFDNSLSFLWSRTRNSLIDYGRLFVVRFATPPNGTLEMIVPKVRFTLPAHLPDLYAGLVLDSTGGVLNFHEELLPRWRFQSSYVRLCDFCSRA